MNGKKKSIFLFCKRVVSYLGEKEINGEKDRQAVTSCTSYINSYSKLQFANGTK